MSPDNSGRSANSEDTRDERVATLAPSVLIVDDDRDLGITIARILRVYAVTVVTTAREALDLIVAGPRFDAIVSDIELPGMSGIDLYEQLRIRHHEAAERMAFASGGGVTLGAGEFLARVSNERIEKPFSASTIRALVKRLVKTDPVRS